MAMIVYGISPLKAIRDVLWIPPHFNPDYGEKIYHDNTCLWGCQSFDSPHKLINLVLEEGISARIVDDLYTFQGWENATFDYHEICLDEFPNLPVLTSKRRNDYRIALNKVQNLDFVVNKIDKEQVIKDLPNFTWDDSGPNMLSQYLYMPELEIEALLYSVSDKPVAISLVKFNPNNKVFYHFALIRIDPLFAARELTIMLCDYAVSTYQAKYIDLCNLALTVREKYKASFFTGKRQGYCWATKQIVEKIEWMHPLNAE